MRLRFHCLFAFLLISGCSSQPYNLAPVSGKVTLDGKPLAGAHVYFAPIGSKGVNPGPAAYGKTGADGKYALRLDTDQRDGAVVGKHRVIITTVEGKGQEDGGIKKPQEKLPAKYNMNTELKADVPSTGNDAADFELKSR